MFGIGMQELLVVLVIALLVLGPKRLPEIARALGKGVREFRKATTEIKESIDLEGNLKKIEEEILIDEVPDENPPRGRDAKLKEEKKSVDNGINDENETHEEKANN